MSDTFESPGYWMASDGKWYPPDRHPDPNYRAKFSMAPPEPPPIPEAVRAEETSTTTSTEASVPATERTEELRPPAVPGDLGVTQAAEFPTVELHHDVVDQPAQTSVPSLSEIHHVHDTPSVVEETDESVDGSADANEAEHAESFSVGANTFSPAPERPVFDVPSPKSVVGSVGDDARPGAVPNLELELDQPPPETPRVSVRPATTATNLSSSTALAVIPSGPPELPPISIFDRVLAAAIFCAGVAMIVGTFLDWTTGSVVQTGWERGDGIATIIAGVIGSATAGPIYVGFHHIVPKAAAVVSGLIGLVVIGLTAVGTLLDSAAADTSIGVGFIVVLAASAVMTLAGLAHRVDMRY